MRITDKLTEYCPSAIPMHMPGHKRNLNIDGAGRYLEELSADIDITEIDGFDNLNKPEGIIRESEERAAKLWNSAETFYLVNGSTSGILSAVFACTRNSKKILVARNCHKAVYNAIRIFELKPVFVLPEYDEKINTYGCVSPEIVEQTLEDNKDIETVIITSPTYEGSISDIKKIAEIVHKYGATLVVDEAHGAHLGLYNIFPENALACGADIVIQSLHKTLPSLTSTAVVHINKSFISKDNCELKKNTEIVEEFRRALTMFTTSSPSYILISSIDACCDLLINNGEVLLKSWSENLKCFYESVKNTARLKVLNGFDDDSLRCFKRDPSKIIITGMNGNELASLLREKYHIEVEMAAPLYVIAMTGVGDTADSLRSLADAIGDIDRGEVEEVKAVNTMIEYIPSRGGLSVNEAYKANCKEVSEAEAEGHIAAEYLWAYPPGIPIIVPGEIINSVVLEKIKDMSQKGTSINSDRRKSIDGKLLIVE